MKDRFKNWREPFFDSDGWAYERKIEYPIWGGECEVQGDLYGWRCQNSDNLKLGSKVDVGCFTYMNAKYGIEIGDNVQIGSHCSIYSINTENETKGKVIIGKNSLIGSFSLILPGAIIPPNSKIKAYSIIK
jgi:acetyltransferase-like isoleucine patch superfamily enzyme